MTTWFAQNSTVNIDSVNQWNDAANGSGNWLTWASLAAGDVLVANGKTSITINVSFTCATITTAATGGTAGGGFIATPGVTITAAIVAGTTNCVTLSSAGSATTIIGNCTGGSATNTGYAVLHSSSGTLNITGNLTAGTGTNSWAVSVSGTGQLNVTGNCTGGSSGTANRGLVIGGAAIVSVTGNVIGSTGSGGQASGCQMTNGSLYVTGNVTAGTQGSGIEINGSVTLIVITGTIQSSTAHPAIYAGTNSAPVCHFGDIATIASGREIAGYITYRIHPSGAMVQQHRTYNTSTHADLGSRSLYTGGVNLNQPAVGNVRSGTTYGAASEYTGTLAVPSPTLVAIGVATDNTVGSYAPSGATAADVADAVWDEARSGHTTNGTFGKTSEWVASGDTAGVTELLTRIPDATAGTNGGLPVLSAGLTVTAVLDSAARVKLHGTQDDYAPLKSSDYTAPLTAAATRTALGMSAADLDTQLDAILAAASAGAGTGARLVTITVNDGTTVLQNAVVRLTEGGNTYRALTNVSGVATFNVDDATYAVAISKVGYSYAGTTIVVNGVETATYSMAAINVTPGSGDLTTGYLTCLDELGAAEANVSVRCQLVQIPSSGTGFAYAATVQVETSAANGLVEFPMVKGCRYLIWRGSIKPPAGIVPVLISASAGSTTALGSLIGD